MSDNTYLVTVEPGPDGPEPALLERMSTIAAFRLGSLERHENHYPVAGGYFDMLDNFEGKFIWDMTDEEFEANPPSRVDFEVISVDPVERPTEGSEIRVVVRIPY